MSPMGVVVWTIGHSTHPIDRFLGLLGRHGIEVLADIRRFPTSRWPQFKQDALRVSLSSAGIAYEHIPELGGYRRGGYQTHVGTEEFSKGLEKLVAFALAKRTAVMCAEAVFFRCHRRYVADALVARGGTVHHIYPDGRVQAHTQRPGLESYT